MNSYLKNAASEKKTFRQYFNIAVSVDCVIFSYQQRQLKVLAIKSDMEEFSGRYSLLGDLVNPDENLETASYRVLKARTGLENVYLKQVHTFGEVNRHPSGRVITTAYYALINARDKAFQLNNPALEWIAVTALKDMAFDHKYILDTCLETLRIQVMNEPLAFNLLDKKFSLRELQEVYEAILNNVLDRRNFRKKIALKNWLTDLHEMEEDVPHRPGKLYAVKKNPDSLL